MIGLTFSYEMFQMNLHKLSPSQEEVLKFFYQHSSCVCIHVMSYSEVQGMLCSFEEYVGQLSMVAGTAALAAKQGTADGALSAANVVNLLIKQ